MIVKVLYLTSSPLHKMHIVDLYIKEVKSAFDVEIWDVSPIFSCEGITDFPEVPRIASITDLGKRLDEILKQYRVVVITNILIYDLHIVYPELKRRKIPVISIDKESIIFWMKENYQKKHPQCLSDNEKRKFKIKSVPGLRQLYSYLEYQHVKFDYILGAYNYFPDACRHFEHIHSLKYDEYLHTSKKMPYINGKYILFMDAGLAHLPSHRGKPNAIDKREYLTSMNSFLKRVEEQFSMPVVVAAHPKSGYQEGDFEGRPIILYKTAELLKYAEIVLAHYSTSLIELVLEKKKVIFMYSEDYMNSDSRTVLETAAEYADMLNAPFVDIKRNEKLKVRFDEQAYDRFIENHIINSEKTAYSNGELIISFLKRLEVR